MSPGASPLDSSLPPDALTAQLLAHAPFVRSLARALVRDGAEAEDVAQESLLAALERPPQHGSLRAWLVGVVRRRALHSARTERRRVAREAQAAPLPAPASPREASERLELFARLVAAVQRLDEPYRATVLRRFFDDVSAPQIASELGVPVETVRTRLKRALERLRGALDETAGGRASWSALLLPWIGTGTSAGVATTTLAGAFAVSTPFKFIVAAAAAVLATTAVWWSTRDAKSDAASATSTSSLSVAHDPAHSTASPALAAAATDSNRDDLAARRDHDAPTSIAIDPNATWIVRAHVHGGHDRPRPLAHVRAKLFDGYAPSGAPRLDVSLVADTHGVVAWPLPPPTAAISLWLCADEPDCTSISDDRTLFAGDAAPQDMTLGCYEIDGEIAGVVLGPDGAPALDATVRVLNRNYACDEHGEFLAPAPTEFRSLQIVGSAPGCAETLVEVDAGPRGRPSRVEIRLAPGLSVRGRVTDARGLPIEGAVITSFAAHSAKGVSDARGDYLLDHLSAADGELELHAQADGFAHAIVTVARGGAERRADFTLWRGARLGGVVLAPDGTPARGAIVTLGLDRFAWDKVDALAHEDGRFEIACAVPGPSKLYVTWRDAAPFCIAIEVPADGATRGDFVLRLECARFLVGHVVDVRGAPVAKANLVFTSEQSDDAASVESDATGAFRAGPLASGPVRLNVFAPGFAMHSEEFAALDRSDLSIVLERAGSAAGRVVDGATGHPLERFTIRFVRASPAAGEDAATGYSSSWLTTGRAFEDADGRFVLRDGLLARAGTVLGLEVRADGFAPTIADHVVLQSDPDPSALRIELWRGSALEGTVVDARDGAPVAGAVVQFGSDAMPFEGSFDSHAAARPVARSDERGRFRLERIPAGRCRLRVDHPGFVRIDDGPIDVPRGGASEARTIRLDVGGSIEGEIVDAAGRPVADAELQWIALPQPGLRANGDQLESVSFHSDASGRFALDHLPTGRIQLAQIEECAQCQVQALRTTVDVESGATTRIRLAPPGRATLRGRAHLAAPNEATAPPVLGVDLLASDGTCVRQTFARGGAFEFAGVAAGTWRVRVRSVLGTTASEWSGAADVTLVEEGNADVTVDVAPRATR